MNRFIYILLLLPVFSVAQNSFITIIKEENTRSPLQGTTLRLKRLKLTAIADKNGITALHNIPDGKQEIEISHIGYKDFEKTFLFPLTSDTVEVLLTPEASELEDVKVSSTRSNRSINNTPTRVEIIAEEEINEEASMRPGDIKMLLAESTGILTQQTSATSANASLRIQGLDGRYTQILKDGFPIYSGAANGLGLLQTPPLDLKQVEIIKGSSSTLYGGGAIAGLINLITKAPGDKRELNFNINATTGGGIDINGFYAEKYKKVGITVLASRNTNKAYDPAGIDFTAIPKFERYTVNPKLFVYFSDKTTLQFGINTTFENRLGGDILFIEGKGDSTHTYFERNKTQRISTQLTIDHTINASSDIKVKNSISYFNRGISSNSYTFNGVQYSTFTEATYTNKTTKSDWVAGVNVLSDQFTEQLKSQTIVRDYGQQTLGAFAQNTWNAANFLTLETGIRGDYVKEYGFALLPHLSALFKIAPRLTTRVGGGFGYKAPTIFTEESERILYKNVLPITAATTELERSYGANWDINFRTTFDKFSFSVNQLFFYTHLKDPLSLIALPNSLYRFINTSGYLRSQGAETNIKLGYDETALYLGYTYTDAVTSANGVSMQNPLTPKHRFNAALVYEAEGKWKVGSELYYFSKQKLNDGSTGRGYWLTGLLVERIFNRFSVYINFENIGDVRQTKFENIFTGTISHPVFKDIYAPLEGFIANGGVKIKL